jgi:hypothetical protein
VRSQVHLILLSESTFFLCVDYSSSVCVLYPLILASKYVRANKDNDWHFYLHIEWQCQETELILSQCLVSLFPVLAHCGGSSCESQARMSDWMIFTEYETGKLLVVCSRWKGFELGFFLDMAHGNDLHLTYLLHLELDMSIRNYHLDQT